MTSEPVRLLEGNASDSERSLLKAGRATSPVDYDVEAGAARFRTELAVLAAAGAVTAAGSNAARSGGASVLKGLFAKLAVKIALGVVAGSVFAGVGFVAGMRAARTAAPVEVAVARRVPPAIAPASQIPVPRGPVPAASASPVTAASAQASAPPLAPSASAVHAPASHPLARVAEGATAHRAADRALAKSGDDGSESLAGSSALSESPASASASASASTPAPASAPVPTPPPRTVSEIQGIALARNLIESDPETALAILDKVRQDHPDGYFVEERQALTVLALARAGKNTAAHQQAIAFLRAYPNGPFSDRVRAISAQ